MTVGVARPAVPVSTPVAVNFKRRRTNLSLVDSSLLAYSEVVDDDVNDPVVTTLAVSDPEESDGSSPSNGGRLRSLLNRRMLVSRKRVLTLGDLASSWRREVLVDSSGADREIPTALLDYWRYTTESS